jgi:hypothetical protein
MLFPALILLLSADNLFEATEAIRKEGEEDEGYLGRGLRDAAPTSADLSGFIGDNQEGSKQVDGNR